MSFDEAFAPAEAQYKAQVMASTWGHLAPKAGDYPISLVYSHGSFGDLSVISAVYPTLQDSPWLAEAIMEFCSMRADKLLPGTVGRWQGTLRWFKDGNSQFIKGTESIVFQERRNK